MRLYNTLTKQKDNFVPLRSPRVTIYACGLTPQNHPHLGHGLSAVRFTILRRYLEFRGYEVTFVENITDVDDKIIARSLEEKKSPQDIADYYYSEYEQAKALLGIPAPDYNPKVSEYIQEIVSYISVIINKGFAYVTHDGDVYFSVSKKLGYGKLSDRKTAEMKQGVRINLDINKRDPNDFALWKSDTAPGASWESPWGQGRPGWHIECSAIANSLLGPTIDIHCGGMDLLFPHHENEIAQCEAHNDDAPFARFWVHGGLLNINGQKMSKSLNNFITLKDGLTKYGAELFIYVVLKHNYRSAIDLNDKLFVDNLNGLCEFYKTINPKFFVADLSSAEPMSESASQLVKDFEGAMDDDLDTSRATVVLSQYLKKVQALSGSESADLQKQIVRLGRVLGLFSERYTLERIYKELLNYQQIRFNIPQEQRLSLDELNNTLRERLLARQKKDYQRSDVLRVKLSTYGVNVLDNSESAEWIFSTH